MNPKTVRIKMSLSAYSKKMMLRDICGHAELAGKDTQRYSITVRPIKKPRKGKGGKE